MALETLTILKTLIVLCFLIYTCYTDFLYRKVSNQTWIWMLAASVWIIVIELIDEGLPCLTNLLTSVIIMWVFAIRLYKNGSIGGGDAKGLMALAVLFPSYPSGEIAGSVLPLMGLPPIHIFTLSVLVNTIFVYMIAPVGLCVYNLVHFESEMLKNPRFMCIGYRVSLEKLPDKKHTVLLESIPDEYGIIEKVWVTPLLPYMIFMTIGYITAIIFGDFLFESIMYLI